MSRFRASLLCALCILTPPVMAATKTWTGAINNLWSVDGNWAGGVAAADGDVLIFPDGIGGPVSNDLSGLDLESITFQGFYNATGKALTLSAGLTSTNNTTWNDHAAIPSLGTIGLLILAAAIAAPGMVVMLWSMS